jgi:CheY-like chemotaxis protein
MSDGDRLAEFEARLRVLKHKLESGLIERARTLRELATRVEQGDLSARKLLKTESHKLRGVAGSYGHDELTELAGQLEQRASVSPPAAVGQLARELADLAERTGRRSQPPSDADTRRSAAPPARRPSQRPEPARGAAQLRVLALDDDPVTQRLLELTLRQVGGFDATIVHSAQRALELLRTEHFDVVIADAMMPDMNGREFRRAARAAGARMPIVILSAASATELGWAAESAAEGGWLRKPFKPRELVQEILRIAQAKG